jgi:hypothetical protein
MAEKTLPHLSINDGRDSQGLRSQRVQPTTPYRVYDPKSLKAMGTAFDAALEAFPHEGKCEARIRRELALLIFYLADRGETDPMRLSRFAVTLVMKRGDHFDQSQVAPIFRYKLIAKPSFEEHPTTRLPNEAS